MLKYSEKLRQKIYFNFKNFFLQLTLSKNQI